MGILNINAYIIVCIIILSSMSGCDPRSVAKIAADKKKYGLISTTRTLTSECSKVDSASIRRALSHPVGPTGGWGDKAIIDTNRTKVLNENTIQHSNARFSGYVKFDGPGVLKIRSYDDVYGSVYCGWYDGALEIPSTEQYVFFSFPTCSVGDGGLDQVNEICWFPKGGEVGKIIYSSAHTGTNSILSTSDVYEEGQLGNGGKYAYLNFPLADSLLREYLKSNKLSDANKLLSKSIEFLSKRSFVRLNGEVINAKPYDADEWAKLLTYKLGLAVGTPSFDSVLKELTELPSQSSKGICSECETLYLDLVPFYRWIQARLTSGKLPALTVRYPGLYSVDSLNVTALTDYLNDLISREQFKKDAQRSASNLFWIGAKEFSDGHKASASEYLKAYLAEVNEKNAFRFELAAANQLLDNLSKEQSN